MYIMLIRFHNVATTVNQEMAHKNVCLFIHYNTINAPYSKLRQSTWIKKKKSVHSFCDEGN